MSYASQYNNPEDTSRAEWHNRLSAQQDYLSQLNGGSWSQPPWTGYGAEMSGGIVAGDEVFQRQFPRFPIKTGGSWFPITSQRIILPEEAGYIDMMGRGKSNFFQRYGQDGDMGFFHGMNGGAEPIGMSPFPPNSMPQDQVVQPLDKPEASVSTVQPVITEPSPMPDERNLVALSKSEQLAEPEQHSLHVPPYSHLLRTGFGKDSALYEEPFEIKSYQGSLHKKKNRFSK
jgi:hypothetical protein